MARKNQEIIVKEVDRLKEMVQTGEILKYSERDLEKQFNLTRKTIRKHLSEIKAEVGSRDIKVISLNLMNILEQIMQDLEIYWRRSKEDEEKNLKRLNDFLRDRDPIMLNNEEYKIYRVLNSDLESSRSEITYYIKQIFQALDKFTDFLERFGIKAKAVDNIAIKSEHIIVHDMSKLSDSILEDIK